MQRSDETVWPQRGIKRCIDPTGKRKDYRSVRTEWIWKNDINKIDKRTAPDSGTVLIGGHEPGVSSKSMISYLPDRMYFADWMRVKDMVKLFDDFYQDFRKETAIGMLNQLGIRLDDRMKTLSKGTKEKVQLVLVMSRQAKLYILDEPIGGVDPAARDFILQTILSNYSEDASVLISTHLISDVEKVLDEVIFLKEGCMVRQDSVDHIRETEGKSVDQLFRTIFAYHESDFQPDLNEENVR